MRGQPFNQAGTGGFTVLELLTVVAIMAILAVVGFPSFQGMIERKRLEGAAESAAEFLRYARSESLRRNLDLVVTGDSSQWCIGIDTAQDCDCTITNPGTSGACALPVREGGADVPVLQVLDGREFTDISVSSMFAGDSIEFKATRGTAENDGMTLASPNYSLRVIISLLGRVRICAPNDDMPGYPLC